MKTLGLFWSGMSLALIALVMTANSSADSTNTCSSIAAAGVECQTNSVPTQPRFHRRFSFSQDLTSPVVSLPSNTPPAEVVLELFKQMGRPCRILDIEKTHDGGAVSALVESGSMQKSVLLRYDQDLKGWWTRIGFIQNKVVPVEGNSLEPKPNSRIILLK